MRLRVFFAVIVASLFATIPVGAQSKPQRIKVRCTPRTGQKSVTLFEDPSSIKSIGELKCGQKVIVTGPPVWVGNFPYVPVTTADKRTGYIPRAALSSSDASDKKKGGPSWREVVGGAAAAMDAYARTSDPHIAWCDNHGGFQERITDTETVNVTDTNTGMALGTGTISHTYIVCKDGTRIKEQ